MKTYTTKEVAGLLKVSSACILEWIRKGHMRAIKIKCKNNNNFRYSITEAEIERMRLSPVKATKPSFDKDGVTFDNCSANFLPHSLLSKS